MRILRGLSICMLLVTFFCFSASAQTEIHNTDKADALTITAVAANERLRFTAPAAVVQMRLEVYNASGRKLLDNELRGGNVLDWHLLDGQAQPLTDNAYLCVITVKSLSGRITQKIGSVKIEQGQARMQPTATSQMTAQQVEIIGPVEEDAVLTILEAVQQPTSTVVAHDGKDGQITRGQGALSFRLGDFYSGKDAEQMRLTAEGNLGIGISQPQTRLDVDGFVRATQGIVFPDGSVQFSASRKTYGATSLRPGQFQKQGEPGQEHLAPDIGGTGTTGRIAKWQDGPNGILNDANLTEASGAIGVNGAPDTRFRLDVNGSTRIRGSNPGFNLEGLRAAGNIWLFQTVDDDGRFRLFSQDNVNPGVERLTISLSTGNVGIGESSPMAKLDVGGAINTSTQYNIGGNRILSLEGFQNLFLGVGTGAVNTGSQNSFFGYLAGNSNTIGTHNTFVGSSAGQANTTGDFNTFFGSQAGRSTTTSLGNAFFGSNAGVTNTTGSYNAFFGISAGNANLTGSFNTFFGSSVGFNNTTGDDNSFFGMFSGYTNTTGVNNSFFGKWAGFSNTTASDNAFFGGQAGRQNTTGNANAFFGARAGNANTTGISNSFFGYQAGFSNTTASNNAFFGTQAGRDNTTGVNNTFFGSAAGQLNNIGNGNSFFGFVSGQMNTGDDNAFFGSFAGRANTTGSQNAYFGGGAGRANTTGSQNAYFGYVAGFANTTGSSNAFFGYSTGMSNTSGGSNAFFGFHAGRDNTAGNQNAFFGYGAGSNNTTGVGNTFIGARANFNDLGSTGDNNTMLGANTIVNSGVSNGTAVGANASVTQNDSLVLGGINGVNGATANTNVGIGTTAPKARLDVQNGNILLGSPGQGLILKSPDGNTCRMLMIDNGGNLIVSVISCP